MLTRKSGENENHEQRWKVRGCRGFSRLPWCINGNAGGIDYAVPCEVNICVEGGEGIGVEEVRHGYNANASSPSFVGGKGGTVVESEIVQFRRECKGPKQVEEESFPSRLVPEVCVRNGDSS